MVGTPVKTRVFLSSTHDDLVEYRKVVKEALLDAGFDVIEMDDFMARPAGAVQVSLDEVGNVDVLIGIYAWRYGWIPPRSRLSITEKEFREARKRKIPCLCFVADETLKARWNPQFIDTGPVEERLAAFKKSISNLTICRFENPERLANQVLSSLHQWRGTQSQVGEQPAPAARDPLRPRLLQFLEGIEKKASKALAQRTASRSLGSEIQWRDRVGGPLGAEPGDDAEQPLPPGGLPELFRDHHRLLILGGPGLGKTVALDRLTLDLLRDLDRSADPLPSFPVPLSLVSWLPTDSDLAEWLVRELNDQLSLPLEIGRKSVEGGRLVPLLDGLDEVAEDDRPACVNAIQRFGGPLVVTCRTAAHESLPEPFHLQADVLLQPVDAESADRYLAQAGPELDVLRAAVREHESLRELARTPLWLKLMCDAFEEAPEETLRELAASPPEQRPHRVVKAYVDRMEKRPAPQLYRTAPTRRRLAFLARQMRAHRMKRFEIELLQPVWLPTLVERWLYTLLTRGMAGGLLAAIPALRYGCLLPAGFVAGLLAGVVDALPFWRLPAGSRASALAGQRAVRVLVISAISVFTFLKISTCILTPLPSSLLLGLVFGLVFGLRPGDLQEHTRIFETLTWKWSWKGGLFGALLGILGAAGLAGLVPVFPGAAGQMMRLYTLWFVVGALAGGLGFLLGSLLGGLQGATAERRKVPNVGLRRGLRKIGETVLRTAVWAIPAGFALGFLSGFQPLLGALSGLLIALFAGLWFGGLDLLQHWTIRALLSATGRFPWRWVPFLDHATGRGLLYRIERGYEFPHDFVRDYFCDLSASAEEAE